MHILSNVFKKESLKTSDICFYTNIKPLILISSLMSTTYLPSSTHSQYQKYSHPKLARNKRFNKFGPKNHTIILQPLSRTQSSRISHNPSRNETSASTEAYMICLWLRSDISHLLTPISGDFASNTKSNPQAQDLLRHVGHRRVLPLHHPRR